MSIELCDEVVRKEPSKRLQLVLLSLLYRIVSENYDSTRKEKLVAHYLALSNELGFSQAKL